ncbi:MAG: C25 family cysteine peptidase, partial [bacterium]
HNVDILPAPVIPLETDDSPLQHIKNMEIYGKDALFPASPVKLSEVTSIRGADAVILGITPFQYNPVTKDLIVYRDLQIALEFEGGNGTFGDEAFRSPYWDGILSDILLNYTSLPVVDYPARMNAYLQSPTEADECEYIIITPTGADFVRWADSIAKFRNEQGILTRVFTVDEIGGNTTTAIEGFINNAYNTWTIKPAACLLLGDYGTDGTKNIISPIWNSYCASDNIYADVVGNDMMPDVVLARMTANTDAQLTVFITKFLDYERNPVTDTAFYNHPITALGWQTERWFQLCSEIVGGYFKYVKGRQPNRINAVYQGNPTVDPWSTATNTSTIINFFGPNGLGYIPATPQELGGFSGGNSTMITNAINAGAFIIQHRDHGGETLWGEPAYNNGNINQLTNDKLIHVFSINCLTGKYNWGSECFTEKFHRHTKNGYNAGALSVTGASETSYSFVNDAYVWGMIDNLWPDFMPNDTTFPHHRGLLPSFGNAAGKWFLKYSNWPYNTGNKAVTYNLFHHHGDAFSCLYDTVPDNLDVTHDTTIIYGSTTFTITATEDALIALSANGELLATAIGAGSTPVVMTIPVLPPGTIMKVVGTMTNYFRHESEVVVIVLTANFSANLTTLCTGNTVDYTDESYGSPTAWAWTFEGGAPGSSTEQNPQDILYATAGTYSVSLMVTKDGNTSTETKTDYITVYNIPTAAFSAGPLCEGAPVEFTDLSNPNGGTITDWAWNFGDGTPTSTLQNPTHFYVAPGTYNVALSVTNNGTCTDEHSQAIVLEGKPLQAVTPQGDATICQASTGNLFTTDPLTGALSYEWILDPTEAGILTGTGTEVSLDVAETYTGTAALYVRGINDCGEGDISEALTLTILEILPAPANAPVGPDTVDLKTVTSSDFTTEGVTGATGYSWFIDPETAGTLNSTGTTLTVTWDPSFRGNAAITVKGESDECSGHLSPPKGVHVKSTVGINELNAYSLAIYPNPNAGKFNLVLSSGDQSIVHIKIYNVLGTIVFSEENVTLFSKLIKTIDLSTLPRGIYHLKVEGSKGPAIKKIVIEK